MIAALADGDTYTYNADNDTMTFDAAGVAEANIISRLTPSTGETTAATITIGGTSQDVIIDSNGTMTAALYLDTTGNLTKNSAGSPPAATVTNVTESLADSTGAAADNQIVVGETVYASTGVADNALDVTGATISASGAGYSVDLDGTTYAVAAGGAVTQGGVAQYVDADGALTTDTATTVVTTYFAQENGTVTDNTGAQVFKNADGELTLDAVTEKERSSLSDLDNALSTVDALRSDLGAIQNRLESSIENLSTTETNLSAARSRIEDADYAVEVANMTRAQILQQAGTSVLAQANQIPQNVLSLLG